MLQSETEKKIADVKTELSVSKASIVKAPVVSAPVVSTPISTAPSKISVDDIMKSQSTDSLIRKFFLPLIRSLDPISEDLAQAETLEEATTALENSESAAS